MSAPPDGPPPSRSTGAVRRALRWYVAWSLVALIGVSAATVAVSGILARDEALADAQATAHAVAEHIVAPLGTEQFHDGDPEARAALAAAITTRTTGESLRHVKLWTDAGDGQGQILWSDQADLVGRTFPMEPEEYALFATQGTVSQLSDLSKEENALERVDGQLVEVYTGFTDSAGQPLLFEAYLTTEAIGAKSTNLVLRLLPLIVGALVLLELATLPLAVSLARRVDRAQADHQRLLRTAVASSDLERQRIARDLHDGVIQDLAGVGYALSAIAEDPDNPRSLHHLRTASDTVQKDVSSLRTLMTDIYPPDLDSRGLPEAVRDLVRQNGLGGAHVTVEVDEPLTPSPISARLAFRIVRESLRNVAKHSRAATAVVRLEQRDDRLLVEVRDDGVGYDLLADPDDGHLGQQLLRDTVRDAHGDLTVESRPGHGTRVMASLPL